MVAPSALLSITVRSRLLVTHRNSAVEGFGVLSDIANLQVDGGDEIYKLLPVHYDLRGPRTRRTKLTGRERLEANVALVAVLLKRLELSVEAVDAINTGLPPRTILRASWPSGRRIPTRSVRTGTRSRTRAIPNESGLGCSSARRSWSGHRESDTLRARFRGFMESECCRSCSQTGLLLFDRSCRGAISAETDPRYQMILESSCCTAWPSSDSGSTRTSQFQIRASVNWCPRHMTMASRLATTAR